MQPHRRQTVTLARSSVIIVVVLLAVVACDFPRWHLTRSISISASSVATLSGTLFTTTNQASIEIGRGNPTQPNIAAFRFSNVSVPPGATIESATLSLIKHGTDQHRMVVNLGFEASTRPADFPTGPPLDQRLPTSTQTRVDDDVWRQDGRRYSLGDPSVLGQSLQQVINMQGWQSGGDLVLLAIGPSVAQGADVSFSGNASDVDLDIVYRLALRGNGTPTPTASNTPTSSPVRTPSPAATVDPTGTGKLVVVGPGSVDDWQRSIFRDKDNRIWIVAADNNPPYSDTGPAQLRIYKGAQVGIPSSFQLVENATVLASNNGTIPFLDAAINGNNQIEVAWIDHGADQQPLEFRVFDISQGAWSAPATTIDYSNLSGYGGLAAQGGLSLAIDGDGIAHIAYAVAKYQTQIRVVHQTANGWSSAEEPLPVRGAYVWHPALAVGGDGTLYLAAYDATNRTILTAQRPKNASWSSEKIIATNVAGPENIDQGPALLVTPAGVPTLTYLNASDYLRVQQLVSGSWTSVDLGADYYTHAPGLGVYADGTLVIAGHDHASPPDGLNTIFRSGSTWGSWTQLVPIHADGSEVFRWAGAFSRPDSTIADLVFFDEDTNDDGVLNDQTLYYIAVKQP